ncbi:hypothetical protein TNCV_1304391 [Trichonephila clavipes]|nr:hypothetical protein TNCV_1304391 [Trichonephila clavipes]
MPLQDFPTGAVTRPLPTRKGLSFDEQASSIVLRSRRLELVLQAIRQEYSRQLYESMPNRITACIKSKRDDDALLIHSFF